MSIKKIIVVVGVGVILTSCSSRGWSCKSRYVHAKPVATKTKAA